MCDPAFGFAVQEQGALARPPPCFPPPFMFCVLFFSRFPCFLFALCTCVSNLSSRVWTQLPWHPRLCEHTARTHCQSAAHPSLRGRQWKFSFKSPVHDLLLVMLTGAGVATAGGDVQFVGRHEAPPGVRHPADHEKAQV